MVVFDGGHGDDGAGGDRDPQPWSATSAISRDYAARRHNNSGYTIVAVFGLIGTGRGDAAYRS